ncbi:MFS transporter [Streptoalloteichus hindustanus]|uniref:Drug resistance transporter, EmrB/QacA subfamily n=1 Tax=Streptoalloteichus hindustanus TaxID=2017 RepID=A0A1M5EXY9_STRHI|nr:MFS transporter [Streptoalloteichus hindustanus]SHF84068.1 drug resistance transporter, EmrB/QacA subfamily [Streptoalloteichus hindustanus]
MAREQVVAVAEEPVGHPRRRAILVALCVALFAVNFGTLTLAVALPTIGAELKADNTALQWIADSYVLALAALLIAAGSVADRFGRRAVLLVGLAAFGMASGLAALCATPGQLVAARAVQGVGAALIMPATLSILRNTFPRQELAKALAAWTAVISLGIAFGPIAGGLLTELFGWSAIFLANVPLAVVAAVLAGALVPESRAPGRRRLDHPGMALSALSLTALVFAVIEAPHAGWLSVRTVLVLAVAVALGALFLRVESRAEHPLVDLAMVRRPRFWSASLSVALAYFAMTGTAFLVPQYLVSVQRNDPAATALKILPVAGGALLAAVVVTPLMRRFGARTLIMAGLGATGLGLALLSLLGWWNHEWLALAALGIQGVGIGVAVTAGSETIMSSVPPDQAGPAGAIDETAVELGGSLGIAVMGSVFAGTYAGAVGGARGVPDGRSEEVARSIEAATAVADQLGGAAGALVRAVAVDSFLTGLRAAALAALVFVAAGVVVARLFLPRHDHELAGSSTAPGGTP